MIRRNAWIGCPNKRVEEPESADVLMTSTEQFAVAEQHVTFVEPPCEAVGAGHRRMIDVSSTKEQRPKQRLRLESFPSFVRCLNKFVLGLSAIRAYCGLKEAESEIN